jgi:hypothetical protein
MAPIRPPRAQWSARCPRGALVAALLGAALALAPRAAAALDGAGRGRSAADVSSRVGPGALVVLRSSSHRVGPSTRHGTSPGTCAVRSHARARSQRPRRARSADDQRRGRRARTTGTTAMFVAATGRSPARRRERTPARSRRRARRGTRGRRSRRRPRGRRGRARARPDPGAAPPPFLASITGAPARAARPSCDPWGVTRPFHPAPTGGSPRAYVPCAVERRHRPRPHA